MGKTKKSSPRQKKVNPLGIPSVREVTEEDDEFDFDSNRGGPILVITEQLQSATIEDKMNALQNLAILSMDAEKVKLICESEIIRIAAPLIVDKNESIRNACAGALRNLSVCNIEICENLVEQDVLTPLIALLNQYANATNWIPTFDSTLKNQLDLKSDTFLQSISLLWNLCESTSIALDNFNQTQLLQSFIRCLDYKIFGLDISIAVSQCILVISEDNPNSWTILNNFVPEFICLLNIDIDDTEKDYRLTFLRTLAAGILSNVPALAAAHLNLIFSALSKTLNVNHRIILGEITSKLPLSDEIDKSQVEIVQDPNLMEDETPQEANIRRRKMDLPTDLEIEVKHIGFLLEAQRVAAEIISNQCSPEDEEWIDDSDDISDEETVHDYDTSNFNNSGNLQNSDNLSIEILEAVKSLGLIEKLWQRAQPIPNNVESILQQNSRVLFKKLRNLRIATLICLQNLCNSMSTEDLGGPNAIYSVWLDIGQQVFQGPPDPLILEPATSLMRASLEHLKNNSELFKQMTENDLELMLNGVRNCSVSEIRANWIRMLGILGCLMPEHLVKIIIAFILETCLKEYDVWTIAEGIDSIMDMFSDNDWNQIAHDLNLLQKSKELQKLLKNKMRQQKSNLKDRYPAVLTVQTNLKRFTKYVEQELKNFRPNNI